MGESQRACFHGIIGSFIGRHAFRIPFPGDVVDFLDPLEEQGVGTHRRHREQYNNCLELELRQASFEGLDSARTRRVDT